MHMLESKKKTRQCQMRFKQDDLPRLMFLKHIQTQFGEDAPITHRIVLEGNGAKCDLASFQEDELREFLTELQESVTELLRKVDHASGSFKNLNQGNV